VFDSVAEIQSAIKESEGNLGSLRERMDEDYDLWALAEYQAKDASGRVRKGYEAYTSAAPRNYFDKVLDGLNRAALTLQIELPEGASEEERRKASQGELYLFGALAEIDRRLNKRGEPPLREGLGFYMCLRGWYAMRALVYMVKDKLVFDVVPWDPIQVTWEMGSQGILWGAFKRSLSKAQIEAEYGSAIKGMDAVVIDFWDAERNSIIIDNDFAKRPTEHKLGHAPISIGAVGSMPTFQKGTEGISSVLDKRGDSVWSAARGLYEPRNKYISWVMDTAKRSVAGSLVHQSKDGKKKLEGDPYQAFQEILTEEGETITPLQLPTISPEVGAVLSRIEQDIQQSTLPYPLAYGGTQQAMSGRALSVLADATRSIYSPRTAKMASAYIWLCEELLAQFAQKGLKATELAGYKPGKEAVREFFHVKIKPSDINPEWFVSVKVEPRMPRDEAEEIMMALAATQKRGPEDIPLMSKQTARENILQIRDPDAEEDKVLEEMGKALPPIVIVNIAAALKRRGKDELAEQIVALLAPKAGVGAQAPPLSPQLVEAIVQALVTSGQPQLAEALLKELGVGVQPPQGQAEGAMGVQPPIEEQTPPTREGLIGRAPPIGV